MAFVRQNFIYNYEIGESQAVNWKTNSDRVKFRTRNSSRGNYPSQRNISWGLSSILVLVHSRRSLTSPAARGFSLKTQQNQGTAQISALTLTTIRDRGPWLLLDGNLARFPCPARGAGETRNGTRLQVQIHYKIVCKNSWAL